MQIYLITVGNRMPSWVEKGYEEFARRMPAECSLNLIEITPEKRTKNMDRNRILQKEGDRILTAIPKNTRLLALDVNGNQWSTEELAFQLENWLQDGRNIALMVGGPDGLDIRCKERADSKWSLSRLTLPHPLVRVIVAEQLYRAWTIIQNHPYHRGA